MKIFAVNNLNFKNNFAVMPKHHYPNLMPLRQDTVTFSGRSELLAESMVDAPQANQCKGVEENAACACYYLFSVLDKYISDLADLKENQVTKEILNVRPSNKKSIPSSKKIATYEIRIKSATSIREKVVSKHARLYKTEHDNFANQVLENLSSYFPIKSGVSEKNITDIIKQVSKHSGSPQKTSAIREAATLVPRIIEDLKTFDYLDFSGYSQEKINSISQNIVSKIQKNESALLSPEGRYIDPKTLPGIKYYANDIVGARIVLKEGSHENTAKILAALQKAVEDGVLRIKAVENNVPSSLKIPQGKTVNDYSYADKKDLVNLVNARPRVEQPDIPPVNTTLNINESKTGYMSIHIDVDLSDPIFKNYGGVYNGYSGEIQIIGTNVEQLKQIEDVCYKLKDKKNAINVAFKPFKDYFLKYYNEDTMEAFDDYTYDLYLTQRLVSSKKRSTSFPTIKELGYAGKVPRHLDFNCLRDLYNHCKNQKKLADQKQQATSSASPEKNIISSGNIKTVKKLIDNKLNQD
ncbi:MAG: hypothetical protein E7Z90_05260 [Cyanobacteria bacterium SIG29]|nr:hypothetical protein [Cyanobacteria bacterium SIG29]